MEQNAKKIGIMGGTFNPPHFGHFIIAQQCYEQLGLDKVLFIPTGKIVYKDTACDPGGFHRYNMLKPVVDSNPHFELSDTEILQSGTTYTANTLRKIKSGEYSGSELFFIVGADSLDYMDKWYKPEVIFSLCTVAAAVRPGIDEDRLKRKIAELTQMYSARIVRVSTPYVDVSSTQLRESIMGGRSIRYLTHDSVIEYINKNKLYGGGRHVRN